MKTDVASKLVVSHSEKAMTISEGDTTLFSLNQDLVEGHLSALLRIGERVAFYRVTATAEGSARSLEATLREAMTLLEGGLFYLTGTCTVRTNKSAGKPPCRVVRVGGSQIAIRNGRLIFPQLYVRDLGNINLDDTGDTTVIYQQLNNLI